MVRQASINFLMVIAIGLYSGDAFGNPTIQIMCLGDSITAGTVGGG